MEVEQRGFLLRIPALILFALLLNQLCISPTNYQLSFRFQECFDRNTFINPINVVTFFLGGGIDVNVLSDISTEMVLKMRFMPPTL